MTLDEFDPDDHEPDNTYEIEVTLTFEEYQFWESDEEEWLEARPIVLRNSLNDWHATGVDPQDVTDEIGWLLQTDLKLWLEGEIFE